MTLHLFGDSYVQDEIADCLGVKDHKRWYNLLSENCNEPYENYGNCGEGPITTMRKFQSMYEADFFDPDDKFVVVLSSNYRIPWKWNMGDEYDNGMPPAGNIYQDYMSTLDNKNKIELEFTDKQLFSIKSFYDCMHDELAFTNIKNILLLKMISQQNDWKMVVFTVFDINMNPYNRKYKKHKYDLSHINDDIFYFYDIPLFEHSKSEWINEDEMNQGMLNHFSEKNHVIISNIITNHFLKTNLSTDFYVNHVKSWNYEESTKLIDFIYE